MKIRQAILIALLGLFATAAGCSQPAQKEVKRVRVSGTVKLDGKLLTTGKIVFDPQNGEPPAEMDILDGKFEGKAAVGKNRVQISAIRKVSMKEKMKMDGPGYDQPVEENALPPRYNSKSEITREVEASGDNVFNFDCQSQ